ncbi:PREDICTED: DNA-directed RNA polymerase III subunit RPC8 [Nanorana parkeri]|uniref:DNA-directed RNA polymerase III subunit RPC8 n=1 Tax=Nanorana parkeri TaxID=125878 RepID=UPI000854023B|nr:PREDICTED: DNA-directed RNA polymerase III subunit RPC8 [Nanorana parkeri]
MCADGVLVARTGWRQKCDRSLLPPSTMFVLVEMVDTVRTTPWHFERKLNDSIAEELNKKLANKVVYNVGLCICLFDITKLEDSYIFPGDGASHTKVHFRYVVFHPFLDEIMMGKIKGCSPEGVHVSLGFFDDIIIPPESLQQPAKFEYKEEGAGWGRGETIVRPSHQKITENLVVLPKKRTKGDKYPMGSPTPPEFRSLGDRKLEY